MLTRRLGLFDPVPPVRLRARPPCSERFSGFSPSCPLTHIAMGGCSAERLSLIGDVVEFRFQVTSGSGKA